MPQQHIHEMPDDELRCAVSERVMGGPVQIHDYVGEVEHAWAVAEKLRQLGWLVVVKAIPDGFPFLLDNDDPRARLEKVYTCSLTWMPTDTPEGERRRIFTHPWAFGETLGRAICRVALEAAEGGN